MANKLRLDPFPDPVGHFGGPWRPFWILQAARRCRRWASAPGAARLVLLISTIAGLSCRGLPASSQLLTGGWGEDQEDNQWQVSGSLTLLVQGLYSVFCASVLSCTYHVLVTNSKRLIHLKILPINQENLSHAGRKRLSGRDNKDKYDNIFS